MRIFYVIRSKNDNVKKKVCFSLKCLMLAFVICVAGVLLCVNKEWSPKADREQVDAISSSYVFDIIELEFPKDTSERVESENG